MGRLKILSPFIIALLFSGFSIFLQVSPVTTGDYYTNIINEPLVQVVRYTSLYFVAYAVLQVPVGILLDKYGISFLLPLGILIVLISCFLHWLAFDAVTLSTARLTAGVGCSIAYISGIFIAASTFSRKYLALCIGLIEIFSTIGAIVAGSLLESAIISIGWDMTNLIVISFAILLFLLSVKFIYMEKGRFQVNNELSSKSFMGLVIHCFSLLKYKKIIAIIIYCFLTWMIIMSFAGFWIKSYFITAHEFSSYKALWISQIYWGSFLVSSLVIGKFATTMRRCVLLVVSMALINTLTFSYFVVPWLLSFQTLVLLFSLAGIATSGIVVALSMLIFIVPEGSKGAAIALTNTFIVLGGFLGQILFGYLSSNKLISHFAASLNPETLDFYGAIFMFPVMALISLVIFALSFYKYLGKEWN
ncbi:MFS transporter [Thiotrichales bacterium 19S9-12]|nr:MFS transporter [Thiotrichales bacterium 19S9-11]MCF6812344.1 MFS transporter [Thiotrichales bacterium 19S9-12]